MDKRQNELRKCLATAYEDKVKGGMDDKASVRLNNQFKRERDQVKETQQKIQEIFETAQKFWTVSHVLRGRSKVKLTAKL